MVQDDTVSDAGMVEPGERFFQREVHQGQPGRFHRPAVSYQHPLLRQGGQFRSIG